MSEIVTLKSTETVLDRCPVFVESDNGGYEPCNQSLELVWEHAILGDDKGEWPIEHLYFRCGHTIEEMKTSIRHADEV